MVENGADEQVDQEEGSDQNEHDIEIGNREITALDWSLWERDNEVN